MDMKLEVVVLPVVDVDRARKFYLALGWRLDADVVASSDLRVIQLTPPGSPSSIIFGTGVSPAESGPVTGLHLAVTDIDAARAEFSAAGVAISEAFHDAGGVFHHAGSTGRVPGPDADRRSYASFATFADPDGNRWWLQEITTRLPGRVEGNTSYGSSADLAGALRRAAAAHGEHESATGRPDPDWSDWYAEYMVSESAGAELPV